MTISSYKDRKLSLLNKIFSKKFSLFSYIDKNRFFLLFILIPHVLIVICYRKEVIVRNQQKTILEFGKIKQRIERIEERIFWNQDSFHSDFRKNNTKKTDTPLIAQVYPFDMCVFIVLMSFGLSMLADYCPRNSW